MGSQFDNTFNQIIIIGNGFDLACKLQSSYYDFFKSFNDNNTKTGNKNKNNGNIWDLIFNDAKSHSINYGNSEKDILWQDVETTIKYCVSKTEKYESRETRDLFFDSCRPKQIYKAMQDIQNGKSKNDDEISTKIAKHLMTIYTSLFDKVKADAQQLGCAEYGNTGKEISDIRSKYWLHDNNLIACKYLEELYKFENEFKDYLNNKIAECTNYRNNARALYFSISDLCDIYPHENNSINDFILSFNYTTPLLDLIKQDDKILAKRLWVQKNVHGTLDTTALNQESPIIFGIDGFQSNGKRDKSVNQIFSKSYRKLNIKEQPLPPKMSNPRRTLFYPISSNAQIHCIKIFGHSLGEADYSYFREIFDSVNLIHGKTVLYILYTEGHKPNPMAIYRLLDRYSDEAYWNGTVESATRIDLLQKLLMEDRIRLREIASPSSNCATTYLNKGDGLKESLQALERHCTGIVRNLLLTSRHAVIDRHHFS